MKLGEREIELLHKYHHTPKDDCITDRGIEEIKNFVTGLPALQEWISQTSVWRRAGFISYGSIDWPRGWQWKWMVNEKEEYTGALSRRISKYVKEMTGINLTGAELTTIGNLALSNNLTKDKVCFDFTNTIDWNPGDFGEKSNSCYWGSNWKAKDMLMDNGALAMRLWDGDQGKARAWLAPSAPLEGTMVMFNGYGLADGYNSTQYIVRILADWLGLNYKKIQLRNYRDEAETLYINGSVGYIIGPRQDIDTFERYDLMWPDPNRHECDRCENLATIDIDDDHLCQSCYNELYFRCSCCMAERDRATQLVIRNVPSSGDYYLCTTCIEDGAWYCAEDYRWSLRNFSCPYCGNWSPEIMSQVEEEEGE